MAWIESHTTMRNHKKIKELCEILKINRAQAIGHLHMLWWWAIENRENGDLSGLFDKDIATACDWDGDPKVIIGALHKTGWLTDYHINDWEDYSWRILEMRKKNRDRQRKHRDITRDITGYVRGATKPDITKHKALGAEPSFLDTLKTNPAYSHINLSLELSKMDAWLEAHPGRKKTHRFVVNWLNKIEAPLPAEPKKSAYDGLRKIVL